MNITLSSTKLSFADLMGLERLGDHGESLDPDLLRKLYAYARGELDQRNMFEGDPTFKRGWVDLSAGLARELVASFVAMDDANTLNKARNIARNNLESVSWNDVLGIDDPPICCRVKIHGSKWGMRFEASTPSLRGRETLNDDLPASTIPLSDLADFVPGIEADPPVASDVHQDSTDEASVVADILRQGGLPA